MLGYVLRRLGEASTWRGLIALVAGAIGWQLSEDQATALVSAGLTLVGLVGAFFPDNFEG